MSGFSEEIKDVPEKDSTDDALRTWLAGQMSAERPYLLAFAYDGVIWGRWDNNALAIAPDSPTTLEKTLQQAFLFGAKDEVRLFHDEDDNWQARLVTDPVDDTKIIEESQILWGDEEDDRQPALPAFLQVKDNRKGIPNQFVPMVGHIDKDNCLRLEVHHMVDYDPDTGEAHIVISRLAGLSVEERSKEV